MSDLIDSKMKRDIKDKPTASLMKRLVTWRARHAAMQKLRKINKKRQLS